MEIQKVRVQVPLLITSSQVVPIHVDHVDNLEEQHIIDQTPHNEVIMNEPIKNET